MGYRAVAAVPPQRSLPTTGAWLAALRWRTNRGMVGFGCAIVLYACGRPPDLPVRDATSIVAPSALVMSGVRQEERGDRDGALARYREALAAARDVYGDDHPNVAFAHAAVGVWHARFGGFGDARRHLRASRRIDAAHGGLFVNVAETRLPASGGDPAAIALTRLRLQRDLALCALEGGCSPARVLGLSDALGEARR